MHVCMYGIEKSKIVNGPVYSFPWEFHQNLLETYELDSLAKVCVCFNIISHLIQGKL
jgi:hypothetical protein